MTKLYVITGFLGSGKTTFLKNFIPLFKGQKLHLIINEYGKEGIDGALLSKLKTTLDEINQGSIFCSCRLDQFETVLARALTKESDVIVIEASGLSDPTNIRTILAQEDKFPNMEFMGCICLVDANSFHKVYQTARVVKKQIAISDFVIINKTDLVSELKVEQVKTQILEQRPDMVMKETTFGKIESTWLQQLKKCKDDKGNDEIQTRDITLRSYLITIRGSFTPEQLKKFVMMFLADTYRVKGFVCLEHQTFFIDCVGNLFSMKPYDGEVKAVNELVVLAGNGLPAGKSIKEAITWYPDQIEKFELVH